MNNLDVLINKKVKNKNGDVGVVTLIDKDNTCVKYDSGETKKYRTEVAFIENHFLTFIDDDNKIINAYFEDDAKNTKNKNDVFEKQRQTEIENINNVKKETTRLYIKRMFLKSLFGRDFDYRDFKNYKKKNSKYQNRINTADIYINFSPEFYKENSNKKKSGS